MPPASRIGPVALLAPLALALATAVLSGLLAVGEAAPYPWQANEVGYDASLDPVVWSRAFAKDTIRKPRHFKAFAMLRNLVGGHGHGHGQGQDQDQDQDQELYRLMEGGGAHGGRGFGPRRSRKFGGAHAWHKEAPPAVFYRKAGPRKATSRRRHKLNDRERYGVF